MISRPKSKPPRHLACALRWLIVVAALRCFVFACDDLRQDELDCEEAVAQLQHCCKGLDVRQIACEYVPSSCEASPTYPDISIQESHCVRDQDCDSLVSSGVCQRAAQIPSARYDGKHAICP